MKARTNLVGVFLCLVFFFVGLTLGGFLSGNYVVVRTGGATAFVCAVIMIVLVAKGTKAEKKKKAN